MAPRFRGEWFETFNETVDDESVMYAEEILRRSTRHDLVAQAYFNLARERVEYEPGHQVELVTSIQKDVDDISQIYHDDPTPEVNRYLQAASYLDKLMNDVVYQRKLTWNLCQSHPVFRYLNPKKHSQVKNHVRVFFDRRYTGLITQICKSTNVFEQLPGKTEREERLLHLRDEHEFGHVAGILRFMSYKSRKDGDEKWTLEKLNTWIWTDLVDRTQD
jgi:hypothetical protein